MRICISHGQFVEKGGAEISLLALAEKLRERGHEIEIFTEFPRSASLSKRKMRQESLKIPLRFLRMVKKARSSFVKADVVLLSINGAIISIPTIWSSLLVSRLLKKPAVALVYEEAIRLDEFTPLPLKLLSLPLVAIDSILFRMLRPKEIVAISSVSGKMVENRYKVKPTAVVWPCFQY